MHARAKSGMIVALRSDMIIFTFAAEPPLPLLLALLGFDADDAAGDGSTLLPPLLVESGLALALAAVFGICILKAARTGL